MAKDDDYNSMGGFLFQNSEFIENMMVIKEAEDWMREKQEADAAEIDARHDSRSFQELCSVLRSRYPGESMCKMYRDDVLDQIKQCYVNKEKMNKLSKEEQYKMELLARLYGVFPEDKERKSKLSFFNF